MYESQYKPHPLYIASFTKYRIREHVCVFASIAPMSGSGVNMARSLGRGRQLSFDGKARKITLSRLNWENWDGRRGRKGGGRGGRASSARRGRTGRHEAEREERREGRRTDGRRGGHHKFCPNFRIRFRSERGLSLLRAKVEHPTYSNFSASILSRHCTGCFMHLCGIVECRLQNGASCKAQKG